MIFPRSIRDCAVLLVDLFAWPINKAIDALDFSDIGDDECGHSVEKAAGCLGNDAIPCTPDFTCRVCVERA